MKVKAWLVVKATESNFGVYPASSPYAGQKRIDNASLSRVFQNKPGNLGAREVCFPIELDVDEGWFLQPTPLIQVPLPAPSAPPPPVTTVQTVTRGRAPSAAASVVKP